MAISSLNDRTYLYNAAQSLIGETSPYELVKSVMGDTGSGIISLSTNDATGKITYTLNAGSLVDVSRQVIAGVGLDGGGALSSDVTLNLDINGLTQSTDIDTAADFVAVYDTSLNTTRKATVDDLTGGVTATTPIGTIL